MIYDGLKVLLLASDLAAAYGAKLLADLGADVVRWEAPEGDPRRDDGLEGAFDAYLHTSQRSVTGDPGPWIAGADIVLCADPLPAGCGAEALSALRAIEARVLRAGADAGPLVVAEISAFGHGGPLDHRNAEGFTDELLQAYSGVMSVHGHYGETPLTVGGQLGEHVAGTFLALGAATAWRRARRTGRPEYVDVSKLEAIQLTMATVPTLMARFPGGSGRSFRFVMIPGNEPTADGEFVGITTVTVAQWKALVRAMGHDDLADDEGLSTMLGRFARKAETQGLLNRFTTVHTAAELDEICTKARVPVSIVGNGRVLVEHEHLTARNVFISQPGGRGLRPRAPFRFHGIADRAMTRAPSVGENTSDRPWVPTPRAEGAIGCEELPLAGVRVLDFTAFWAGPFATSWLAAFGADVIKVESVQRPDGIRFSALVKPSADPDYYEKSALFHAANLNKRGITLDLSNPRGQAIARDLIAQVDVVVENFTPRVMESFGFSEREVLAINPRVVYLREPAFGLTGPWRERPGFAQTMEQLSGMAWVTGYEGGPPVIPGGVVDPAVGTHAALALVAALEQRDRTGDGIVVEMAMIEVAASMTAEQVVRWTTRGELSPRRGAGGVYRCSGDDEWLAVDCARDPMAASARAEWCERRTAPDAASELCAAGVPAAAMLAGHGAIDDPQMRARGFFQPLEHPHVGRHEFPTWPVRFANGPHDVARRPAPTLGQHTRLVLAEMLGLEAIELDALEADHVIGTRPLLE